MRWEPLFRMGLSISVLVVFASGQQPATTTGEDSNRVDQEWRDDAALVDQLVPQVFSHLSSRDSAIVNSISWRVDRDVQAGQMTLPNSFIVNGEKTTVIGQGFMRQLFLFIEAETYGGMYGKQEEVDRHISDVLRQIQENISLSKAGGIPKRIPTAREYFDWDTTTIKRVDTKAEATFNANLAFILAHEAGHHVLGHTNGDYKSRSQEERLSQEEAADKWATQTLVSSGQVPISATFSLVFFERLYTAGFDSSHPTNGCRARALVLSSIEAVDRLSGTLSAKKVNTAAVKDNLSQTLSHMDESGACPAVQAQNGGLSSRDLDALSSVLEAANRRALGSLRGRLTDNDPELREWESRVNLPSARSCSVNQSPDDHGGYEFVCKFHFDSEEDAGAMQQSVISSAANLYPGARIRTPEQSISSSGRVTIRQSVAGGVWRLHTSASTSIRRGFDLRISIFNEE